MSADDGNPQDKQAATARGEAADPSSRDVGERWGLMLREFVVAGTIFAVGLGAILTAFVLVATMT